MDYENTELDNLDIPENKGLMRVLENKQKEIDNLKNKIDKIEDHNNRLDHFGKVRTEKSMNFEFELEGKIYIRNKV